MWSVKPVRFCRQAFDDILDRVQRCGWIRQFDKLKPLNSRRNLPAHDDEENNKLRRTKGTMMYILVLCRSDNVKVQMWFICCTHVGNEIALPTDVFRFTCNWKLTAKIVYIINYLALYQFSFYFIFYLFMLVFKTVLLHVLELLL